MKEKTICIDWFQATIKDNICPIDLFTNYFNVPSSLIVFEDNYGLFGYNRTYSYKNI